MCLVPPENTTVKGLSTAEEKAQRYYQACMSEARIEALGGQPLQDLINQVGSAPQPAGRRLVVDT